MKREYIIFKVYAECPMLRGWLRLGNDAGIFELVSDKERADMVFNSHFDTEESARVSYGLIRKSVIEYVYEILYIECQTMQDCEWLESQTFFGHHMRLSLSKLILHKKIKLLNQQLT